jgi:hypothetical protein
MILRVQVGVMSAELADEENDGDEEDEGGGEVLENPMEVEGEERRSDARDLDDLAVHGDD